MRLSGNLNSFTFDNQGDKRKLISVEQWGDTNWSDLSGAFHGCNNMVYNATDAPNFTGFSDLSSMFFNCDLFN